jgi:hypothetical protein
MQVGKVHVVLVSDQVLQNLIPVLMEQPHQEGG